MTRSPRGIRLAHVAERKQQRVVRGQEEEEEEEAEKEQAKEEGRQLAVSCAAERDQEHQAYRASSGTATALGALDALGRGWGGSTYGTNSEVAEMRTGLEKELAEKDAVAAATQAASELVELPRVPSAFLRPDREAALWDTLRNAGIAPHSEILSDMDE